MLNSFLVYEVVFNMYSSRSNNRKRYHKLEQQMGRPVPKMIGDDRYEN